MRTFMLRAAVAIAVVALWKTALWGREPKWVTVADQQDVPEVLEAPPARPAAVESSRNNASNNDEACDECDGCRYRGGRRARRMLADGGDDVLFGNCSPACADPCGAPPCGTPCWHIFGEYLLLRPGNAKVSYAVPVNGPDVPLRDAVPVQVAPEAVVESNFHSGFRAGAARALSECATLGATYSYFDGTDNDAISVVPPLVLHSQVRHPSTDAASTTMLDGNASLHVQFQLADVEYRRLLVCGECSSLSGLLGFRYGHLRQGFGSTFSNSTTVETVDSEVTFDGAGLRLGLDAQQYVCSSGLTVYSKAFASFLGGTQQLHYTQADNFHRTVVSTGWDEDRIVSILDLELGLGWTSPSGRLRLTAGWLVSAWLNTINTGDFIRAVQNNSSNQSKELSNALTFDGLTSRLELRY